MINKKKIYTFFVFLGLAIYILNIFIANSLIVNLSSIILIFAMMINYNLISEKTKKQSMIILIISFIIFLLKYLIDGELNLKNLINFNLGIIILLISVGMISSINVKSNNSERDGSLVTTYLNINIIGAIINYASVIIFGDKISRDGRLKINEAILLSRAFASAGFWSPFFATSALAFNYSKEANQLLVLSIGSLVTFASIIYCYFEDKYKYKNNFNYISISVNNLLLPSVILILVMIFHYFFSNLKFIDSIVLVCPIIYIIYNLFKIYFSRNSNTYKDSLNTYYNSRLVNHSSEILLFTSIGVFVCSLMNLSELFIFDFSFLIFNNFTAIIFVVIVSLLSLIGIHPILSISFLYGVFSGHVFNANLLATTIIFSWALSSTLGPLSAQNLGIQTKFNVNSTDITKGNIIYTLYLMVVIFVIFFNFSLFY